MQEHKKLMVLLAAGISSENDMIQELLGNPATPLAYFDETKLAKDDLLSAMVGSSKHLFEEKAAWDNFGALAARVIQGGGRFQEDDFTRNLRGSKSLIDMAVSAGKLEKLFDPAVFAGDAALFEKLWYKEVPWKEREKLNVRDVRRLIAGMKGEKIREDVLSDAGVTVNDMRDAIKKGQFTILRAKLKAANDHLRAEDLVLLDSNGKTVYEDTEAWNNFPVVVEELRRNHELPKAEFFTKPHGVSKSFVVTAADKSKLKELFTPVLWQYAIDALLDSYSKLSVGDKNQVNIELLTAQIDDLNYGPTFVIDENLTLDALVAPLNPGWEESGQYPIRPIGLPSFWSNFEKIKSILADKGTPITLAALQEKSGAFGVSGFRIGVQQGHIEKILAALAVKDAPGKQDYLETGGINEMTLASIKSQDGLCAVFNAARWTEKPDQFLEAWKEVASSLRFHVDIDEQHRNLHQAGFRSLRRSLSDGPG